MRSARAFMVLSLAGLVTVVGLASWYDHKIALQAAEDRVQSTVGLMREHALNVFQTQELVYEQIRLRTAGLDWDSISRSKELASFLQETPNRMSQISSIWLADSTGHVRASSGSPYPRSLTFENRDDFRAHREGDHGMLVGEQQLGTFGLTWRRSLSTGEFDGVVGIEIGVENFESFFRDLDVEPHRAVLVRADGAVLSPSPGAGEPQRFPPSSELMRSIASGVQSDNWSVAPNGIAHFFRWRQLDPYPVYVGYAVDQDVALASWHRRILSYALIGATIWSALCVIAHLASRRAAAEAALQQAQRMEAIGQLASGVAHDFNNVLTAVIGNVDLIALERHATQRVRQLAEAALRAAHRGSSLTAQLLAFARRQPLQPQAVRVDGLLDAMLPLIKGAIGETTSVSCKLAHDLSAIRVDPGQFEAALLNLALNARDAMPDGGTLRIEARNVIVEPGDAARRTIRPGGYVVIEISDTGGGMSADTARRAFEPFFTTKAVGKGTGLGLSMVYGFARQSGGTAEIANRGGSGATIKLYFPRSDETVPPEPPPSVGHPASSRKDAVKSPALTVGPPSVGHPAISRKASILIVEDQDEIRQLLADSLDEFGHEVSTARTATEAIELLERRAWIEVLVTDITLPGGMTGVDLVRRARELMPDLKILTISGGANEEAIRASPLDRCAFLPKPFRPSDLNRAVAELL